MIDSGGASVVGGVFPTEAKSDYGDLRATKSFNIGMYVISFNASCKHKMMALFFTRSDFVMIGDITIHGF